MRDRRSGPLPTARRRAPSAASSRAGPDRGGGSALSANADVVRAVYDAFNERDYERAVGHAHEDIVCRPAFRPIEQIGASADTLRGRAELFTFFDNLGEGWEEVTVQLEEVLDAPGDRVLATESWRTRGRDGIELATRIFDLYAVEDGLVTSTEGFLDRREAMEAAGLA